MVPSQTPWGQQASARSRGLLQQQRKYAVQTPWGNQGIVAWWLDIVTAETAGSRFLRVVLSVLYLGVGIGLLVLANYCGQSVHVLFWLGLLPQLTLLVTLLALAHSFLLLVYIRLVQYFRHRDAGQRQSDRNCEPSPGSLQCVVILGCLLAAAASVLGSIVVARGLVKYKFLHSHCGRRGASHELEETYAHLSEFFKDCKSPSFAQFSGPEQAKAVTECPGFTAAFPPPAPYAAYLLNLEVEEGCGGFCHDRPQVFVLPPDKDKKQGHERCSAVVARELWKVSLLTGLPGIVLGTGLALASAMLLTYDGL